MDAAPGLLERFLLAHGLAPERVGAAAAAARARAARYPLVGPGWALAEQTLDRLAPALLLGRACPARALGDDDLDRLEGRLAHHPLAPVRVLWTFLRAPAWDQLYPDQAPPDPGHPLEALLERARGEATLGRDRFDVVVIGSGAGGAPLAWSLQRRGLSVAIVEAGGLVRPASSGEALERHYLNQGLVGSLVKGGMTLVLAGQAVGGTTVINSGTSLPPRAECLEAWDAALGTDFAGGSLQPWIEAAQAQAGITVPRPELLDASAGVVRRGLEALGRAGAYTLPRNAPTCRGAGRCCFGCPNGAKLSTDRAWLPEALQAGALLFAHTRARAIREERDRVEVLIEGPDGRRRLRARAVVIAAGALSTPELLRENRLGERWREAGRGLRIHPASKVFGLMPAPLAHGGVPQGLGYHAPELPRVGFEGVHTPPGAAAPMIAAAGRRHRWWMERYDRLATYGLFVRDRRPGWVRRMGPHRHVHYELDREDARDLGSGLLLAAEALFAAGAERVLLPLTGPGVEVEVESTAALRRLSPDLFTPQRLLTCGFHPHGTAGMGRVVDDAGRLLGSRRVWVADASVLPDSPGVNPMVTIMALALRSAERLAERV